MKMHLSVSLGAEEVIWQTAEWCAASYKGEEEKRKCRVKERVRDRKRREKREKTSALLLMYFKVMAIVDKT